MILKRRLILLALLPPVIAACDATRLDTKTFVLTNLDPSTAVDIVEPYVFVERQGAPGRVSQSGNAISVRETPDNLGKIERLLSEMDRSMLAVRLHYRILRATATTTSDPDLKDVEPVLKGLLRFPGYELLGEVITQVSERGTAMQTIPVSRRLADGELAEAQFALRTYVARVGASGDTGVVILDVSLAGSTEETTSSPIMSTQLGVRIGEVAALGTAPVNFMSILSNPKLQTVVPDAGTVIVVVKAEVVRP